MEWPTILMVLIWRILGLIGYRIFSDRMALSWTLPYRSVAINADVGSAFAWW